MQCLAGTSWGMEVYRAGSMLPQHQTCLSNTDAADMISLIYVRMIATITKFGVQVAGISLVE